MLVRAIVLGVEVDQMPELRRLYAFDNSADFATRYSEWDDGRFLDKFNRPGTKCGDLLSRLLQRSLLKRVFAGRPTEFRPDLRERLKDVMKPVQVNARRLVEGKIRDAIAESTKWEIDADLVIYHAFDIKSVKEMSRNDEASILVKKLPQPVPFEVESTLFGSINERQNDEFVEVYAPVSWERHADRDKRCSSMRSDIIAAIEAGLQAQPAGGAQ